MAQEIADSTLIDTWSSGGNIVEPDISKIIEGWQLGEQPPHEYMNWLQNTFGSKLNHILKNGVALWNNTTQYLAGSSVQHNGNVWLCKTTNTNSDPTDANANWKRIITVESLATVLGGYVALTGNQTISGVKTFSSSPIVPTPTDNTQAVNKAYADTKTTLATANSYDLGVGQTWQDVTASRSVGVTYTNTTGKPIIVSLRVSSGVCAITVSGIEIGTWNASAATTEFPAYFIVGDGETYSSSRKDGYWYEYR